MAGEAPHHLTVEEYLDLAASTDGLLEYHDGTVVAMVAPTTEHARLVAQLVRLLQPARALVLHRRAPELPHGVTAEDVAQAFVALALGEATTGTVLTMNGGNIAASPR